MNLCHISIPRDRRHAFWSTQPDCDTDLVCGTECGVPGLQLITSAAGATIMTANYVRGLMINIMMTDGEVETTDCGVRPGTRGGHWSGGYSGTNIGSRIRQLPATGSVDDLVPLIQGYAQLDLEKLVRYGVAERVEVKADYAGNGRVNVVADAYGRTFGAANVAMSATRLANQWAWAA